MDRLDVRDFAQDDSETIRIAGADDGHGGSDYPIMAKFVRAVAENDEQYITTTFPESVATHTVTFAAEHARRTGEVVDVQAFARENGSLQE